MNKKLFDALVSMSSTSSDAKNLAARMLSESSVDIAKQLYAKIDKLEAQIATMQMQLIPEDEEVSNEDANALAASFGTRLHDANAEMLYGYSRLALTEYSKPVRLIIVTVLRNKAIELKIPPLDLWFDIIALGGEMK